MAARSRFLLFCLVLASLATVGCTPQIGDKCILSTDCSLSGDKQCDTSMPGGYCTVFNCGPNTCPNQTACYLFHAAEQGCSYNDREPGRSAHSFCMKDCQHDSDCRPGYVCRDLRTAPWNAVLLDDNQNQSACAPAPDQSLWTEGAVDASDDAPVCSGNVPEDAAFPPLPDSAPPVVADAGSDAEVDAQAEGGADGGGDAGVDAGFDATVGDAGTDATVTDAGGGDASDATID